uniref:Sorting nexin 2 n=1 Tax=Scophthalmus maximus TaxID=52904 RepID=A0A8D3CS45_SCOMX
MSHDQFYLQCLCSNCFLPDGQEAHTHTHIHTHTFTYTSNSTYTSTTTTSTTSSSPPSEPASLPAEDISTNSNGPKQDSLFDDDPEDLFAEATEEVSLDSPERDVLLSDGPSPAITPITPPLSVITPCLGHDDMFTHSSFDEIEEEELNDSFDMHISVSDPEKVGDGMNAYMAYKVTTKTSVSLFKRDEFSVKRRFSDFLGLHSKLASKYLHIGYIVPPAPEKSIVGMTKVKVGKEDQSSNEFVEKRRSALERYLLRTVKHPVLLKDPDVLQFLESSDLPRAVSTQALSSAGLLRMVNKAADAVNKMTIKMNESDAWFEEKQQHFENLDVQLRKLHASVESLVCHRKGTKRCSCFHKVKLLSLHLFSGKLRSASSECGRSSRRAPVGEQRGPPGWGGAPRWRRRSTKVGQRLEAKVHQGERDFEQISKTIRKEVGRFEKERVKDFKTIIIKYLESLVQTQQQLIKYWDAFLPEAKAIS